MMLSLSFAGQFFGVRFNKFFRKVSPYVAIVVAVFLIYRGISFETDLCCQH
jgi:hypothetical protein